MLQITLMTDLTYWLGVVIPGRILPYLDMVERVRSDDPVFLDLLSDWVPILGLDMI